MYKVEQTRKFRVLRITNNPEEYDHAVADSEEFPELVEEIGDEYAEFILDLSTGETYPADEFFCMVDVFEFTARVLDYPLGAR